MGSIRTITIAWVMFLSAAALCLSAPGSGAGPGTNNSHLAYGKPITVTDSLPCGLTGTIKARIGLDKKITLTLEGKAGEKCTWEGMSYTVSLSGNGGAYWPGCSDPPVNIHKMVFQLDGSKYNHLDVRLDVRDGREGEKHHLFVKLECSF